MQNYQGFLASKAIRAKERGLGRVPDLAPHLFPFQRNCVVERALVMWSNGGDVVLSPFMGIGSEGVTALKLKRKFIGIELKESYWRQACRYLDAEDRQGSLFDEAQVA